MTVPLLAVASAIWLGILTSISPCPLATNIAAISFIGQRIANTRHVVWSGLSYTTGRALTYAILGIVIVGGLQSTPGVSQFLQKYMNKILGPLLILVGMFLLELMRFSVSVSIAGEGARKRAEKGSVLGAGVIGILFALSFCPISAGLFFVGLTGLALEHNSPFALPLLYGIGTALPVVMFSILVALGAKSLGSVYNKLTQIEFWARRVTGIVFICVGVYYCLRFIFGFFAAS